MNYSKEVVQCAPLSVEKNWKNWRKKREKRVASVKAGGKGAMAPFSLYIIKGNDCGWRSIAGCFALHVNIEYSVGSDRELKRRKVG